MNTAAAKREDIRGKLRIEGLPNLYTACYMNTMMKSKKARWSRHVTGGKYIRNA
jgi:hypothetical protein